MTENGVSLALRAERVGYTKAIVGIVQPPAPQ
jgi:hypothetical protein